MMFSRIFLSLVLIFALFCLYPLKGGVCQEEKILSQIFEYPPTKEKDPFSPLIKKEEKEKEEKVVKKEEKLLQVTTSSEYELVGIVWCGGEAIALIKKRDKSWVVSEGMILDSLKVARIEGNKGEVILIGENKIIKLKMLEV